MTRHSGREIRDSAAGIDLRVRVCAWSVYAVVTALTLAGCGSDSTPTTPSNTSNRVIENWSGVLAPGGASTRSFSVNTGGTIVVTLSDVGTMVGLGVGVPRTTGGGCRLGVAVNASAATTPQISERADAGQYCVQLYDLGTLRDPVGFTLKIEHP